MKNRLDALAHQRLELFARIEAQRGEIAEIAQRWQKPLALADTGLTAVRFIRNHPALVSGGVAALLAWRRKGIVGLAQKGWRLSYLYPSLLAYGLKFLSPTTRSQGAEHKTEVCH